MTWICGQILMKILLQFSMPWPTSTRGLGKIHFPEEAVGFPGMNVPTGGWPSGMVAGCSLSTTLVKKYVILTMQMPVAILDWKMPTFACRKRTGKMFVLCSSVKDHFGRGTPVRSRTSKLDRIHFDTMPTWPRPGIVTTNSWNWQVCLVGIASMFLKRSVGGVETCQLWGERSSSLFAASWDTGPAVWVSTQPLRFAGQSLFFPMLVTLTMSWQPWQKTGKDSLLWNSLQLQELRRWRLFWGCAWTHLHE